ncbi:MAG: PQQ-binding-like beta-propeller repeat protein [Actinomycetota bacterium]|nr:PQQ-binding-like beta-propeller repeat protein [Actinomycetota bacterium]
MRERGVGVAEQPSRSDAALERHHVRLRHWRVTYAALILAAAVALVVIVKIAYSHGELSHATLRTVDPAPPSVTLQAPRSTLGEAWSTADRTAIGQPYWGGTVVTHDKRSVRGRDALTGAITWIYTRTDRTICQAIQDQGITIGVYELNGNCDQLTALDTETGQRKWSRTLDKDGAELNGHPRYAVVPDTVMLTTPSAIYALDPTGGLDRWVFREHGCTVRRAVLGVNGALISQTCSHRDCAGARFCGNGAQLLLRDGSAGENSDSSKNNRNPDQIKWNLIGSDLIPASAGQAIAALSANGAQLIVLGDKLGTAQHRLPLVGRSTTITTSAAADADLLRIGARTYALANSTFSWQTATSGLPTVTDRSGVGTPSLSSALLAAPTTAGIATLDPGSGTVRRSFAVGAPALGSRIYPFGTGFLVTGTQTRYYR